MYIFFSSQISSCATVGLIVLLSYNLCLMSLNSTVPEGIDPASMTVRYVMHEHFGFEGIFF